jgi:catechol 2,3-dioxygenase-like lactoylglutathione lyase family enzyme
MVGNQFRFSYFTPEYDATVAYYRDGLGLPVFHSWDRSPDDRGTLIEASSGLIEILASPSGPHCDHLFDPRPPQGVFMVIEVDDVDKIAQRASDQHLEVQQNLTNQSWGHRTVCLREPNGLSLLFFTHLPR